MISGTIIDTSIWIDYFNTVFNNKTNAADTLLENKSRYNFTGNLQEILQGIKDKIKFDSIKELLLSLEFFQFNQIETAIDAASLYRFLKTKGVTIRKPNDCLIAVVCINNNIALLDNDKDFDNIAKYTTLKIYKPEQ